MHEREIRENSVFVTKREKKVRMISTEKDTRVMREREIERQLSIEEVFR